MSYQITCPYCFKTMQDHEVHFRSERVVKAGAADDVLPDNYYDIGTFVARYTGSDKNAILKRYYELKFFEEGEDEAYERFWKSFVETTEFNRADQSLGVRAQMRKVIDPNSPDHQAFLEIQEDGTPLIRDPQGMVVAVELKTGEKCTRRVCPHCHNPLPLEYGKNRQRFVSVIGITGAGKTVYLSQLLRRMREYASHVGLAATVNSTATKTFLDNNPISVDKSLPGSTPANRLQQPLFYEMERDAGGVNKVTETFVLYDVAGEVFTDPNLIRSFAPFIENSDGLVLLLDPFQFEVVTGASLDAEQLDNPSTALDAIHTIVSGNSNVKCKIPLAVCISKVDTPEVRRVLDAGLINHLNQDVAIIRRPNKMMAAPTFNAKEHNQIARALDEWFQANDLALAQQLEAGYSDYSYFAFTALGCGVKDGKPEGPILPKRIEEPILWLFNRLEYIGANERLYNPAGEIVTCVNCGSDNTEEVSGDAAYITEGWGPFKKKKPVNRKCNSCGHMWMHVDSM